ncbi:DUF1566 domain-containing protein [Pseudorhodoferax soli]|uniref:Uncharacterized protein DUF1566 n=1 Tax=Pseudorhodoferax soli TaxID=545864 RepID=A0A368Y022_9BURK|nr:DUF1566 domain-containing protein [Pseudorhodoferax soli]RCW71604.1 uncharacterized protein DUF1566 [Pseudorhodoferax soli]
MTTTRISRATLWLAVAAACVAAAPATAQTSANGPYYAMPSWDQTLPAASRFIVLSNFASQAVLDRETGLVWERTPSTDRFDQTLPPTLVFGGIHAEEHCLDLRTGGRMGWRLPSAAELASLIDPTRSAPALPAGHPFDIGTSQSFWTSSRYYPERFAVAHRIVNIFNGVTGAVDGTTTTQPVWCVRGGADAGR